MAEIFGTQYDDTIILKDDGTSTVTTTSGTVKSRKSARQTIEELAGFANFVYAGDGNDRVYGAIKDDQIDGGNGDDLLYGGGGNDLLIGGNGKDQLVGGSGDDFLGAATKLDTQTTDNGGDLLIGDGSDPAYDKDGKPIEGDALTTFGNDTIAGGNAKDEIWGDNRGNDTDGADDNLAGGNGDDAIHGGGGNDRIQGDNGADQLWGGSGNDEFKYDSVAESNASSFDTIHDFDETTEGDHDVIDLLAFGGDLKFGGMTPTTHGVWYEIVPGFTFVYADTDSDGAPDLTIRLVGEKDLTADDFLGVIGGDVTPPDAPVVASITDDTGSSATDEITNDNKLVINGTAEANSSVEVFKDGVSIGTTTADGSGDWSFDYTGTTLPDGDYDFTAKATDAAGNTSDESTALPVTVDTDADLLDNLSVTVTDDVINNAEKTAVGFTVAGLDVDAEADVTFTDSALNTVVVHVTGNGLGSANLSTLLDGAIAISIVATDTAGNTANGAGDTLTLDTTPPTDLDFAFVSDPGIVTDDAVVGTGITLGKFMGTDNLTVNPDFTFEIRQVRTAAANSATFGVPDATSPFPPFAIDTTNDLLLATAELAENTNYEITIRVTDQAGNYSDEIINVITGSGGPNSLSDATTETPDTRDDDDVLFGLNSTDIISGLSGDDTLYGGAGDDTLKGGTGNDTLIGGTQADHDTMNLGGGEATGGVTFTFDAGAGTHVADLTSAGLGIDTYEGIERVIGTSFDDTIGGAGSNDKILGAGGDDTLSGGGGSDLLDGGDHDDVLNGENGDDTLNGGTSGVDILNGGAGNDTLIYGAGDTFNGGDDFDTLEAAESFTYKSSGISNVELVSLGDGNHSPQRTVTINAADVLDANIANTGAFDIDLFVAGDSSGSAANSDTVDFDAGFAQVDINGADSGLGTFITNGHTYALWQSGSIQVAVEVGLNVNNT